MKASGRTITFSLGVSALNELVHHLREKGGILCLITGQQGSGKTTLLIQIATHILRNNEIVIWRGRNRAQWHRFPNWHENVVLHVHQKYEPHVYIVNGASKHEIEVPYYRYKTIEGLYSHLQPGKINVIYGPSSYTFTNKLKLFLEAYIGHKIKEKKEAFFWYEFIHYLTKRLDSRFISVFIDEFDDLAPYGARGIFWKLIDWFKDAIKDCRKAYVSIYGTVHNLADVDYRVLRKFTHFVYLKGARVPSWSVDDSDKVRLLQIGVGIVESGQFGYFNFYPLPDPDYDVIVDLTIAKKKKGGDEE